MACDGHQLVAVMRPASMTTDRQTFGVNGIDVGLFCQRCWSRGYSMSGESRWEFIRGTEAKGDADS
jgi:hypothetical protein